MGENNKDEMNLKTKQHNWLVIDINNSFKLLSVLKKSNASLSKQKASLVADKVISAALDGFIGEGLFVAYMNKLRNLGFKDAAEKAENIIYPQEERE